jgi:hypothetical protein
LAKEQRKGIKNMRRRRGARREEWNEEEEEEHKWGMAEMGGR